MSAGSDSETVRLDVPATTEQLRLVRLVVVALATAHGADMDDLEDLRIATGELCTALVGAAGDDGRLLVEVTATRPGQDDGVVLALALHVPGAGAPDDLDELASMVLQTTTDRFGLGPGPGADRDADGPPARAWFERRLPAGDAALGAERSGNG